MLLMNKARALMGRLRGPRYQLELLVREELARGEPELALIPLFCDRDHDFVDVGANRGVYSFFALPYCHEVVAIEANPDLAGPLRQALTPNGRVVVAAASDHEGFARLSIPYRDGVDVATRSSLEVGANPGFSQRELEVRLTTIDLLKIDKVNLIKIDVEGHEHSVLNGCKETLFSARPVCIVECEERHNRGGVARTFGFFSNFNYEPYFLHRGVLRNGSEFDVEIFQKNSNAKGVDSARSADYINNFIFLPSELGAKLAQLRAKYG